MRFPPRGFAACICAPLFVFLFAFTRGAVAPIESAASSAAGVPLAITHVTIVNPKASPLKDMTVVVSGATIEWVGKATDTTRPKHANEFTLDASGKFQIGRAHV